MVQELKAGDWLSHKAAYEAMAENLASNSDDDVHFYFSICINKHNVGVKQKEIRDNPMSDLSTANGMRFENLEQLLRN